MPNEEEPMPLTLWDPFAEIASLRDEMERMFERTLGRAEGPRGRVVRPLAGLEEDEEAYRIELDLPGVRPDDLAVETRGRTISIRGERTTAQGACVYERSITLPDAADMDRVAAEYRDGVLHLRIPKREETRPKRIPVVAGGEPRTIEAGAAGLPGGGSAGTP
jgi:HSP20 family protein